MDSKKFGEFIATIRKEKGWTQAELAEKISVTDKAVSRWERGLGFPDINTIKPLADVLEVSVLEIMQSEREPKEECSCTVEKHKAKQRQPALPLFRSQGNAIEKFIAVCYT